MICVKRINERNVKQRMLFERSEFIRCSVVSEILRKSFAVLILCYFLIKKKVNRLKSLRLCISSHSFLVLRKEHKKLETVYSISPSKDFIIIDARNNHCVVRCAEPNNHILYRLIKTTLKLYLRTLKYLAANYCFPVAHKKKCV